MNVFLTGGTGFIGSYVALELVKHGHHVTILARNRNKVPELTKISALEIVPGDITDRKLLEQLVAGKDACILIALNYTEENRVGSSPRRHTPDRIPVRRGGAGAGETLHLHLVHGGK